MKTPTDQYIFRCIIPYERDIIVIDKIPTAIEEHDHGENHAENFKTTSIVYYGPNQSKEIISKSELGDRLLFDYTDKLIFLHEKELRGALFSSISVPAEFKWLDAVRARLLCHDTHPDVSVRYMGIQNGVNLGHGVFADINIPKGTFIGEYTGLVSSVNETITQDNHYNFQYPCGDGGLEINGRDYGNLTRFINHSSTPNAEFRAVDMDDMMHVVCITSQDITGATELLVDYGAAFWQRQRAK